VSLGAATYFVSCCELPIHLLRRLEGLVWVVVLVSIIRIAILSSHIAHVDVTVRHFLQQSVDLQVSQRP
jgi:hypothetical protein